jgi:hypothetical protein
MRYFESTSLVSLSMAALCAAAWLSGCGSDQSEGSDSSAVGGSGARSGTGGRGAGGTNSTAGGANITGGVAGSDERFSFFVTSLEAMRQLSGNTNGFGGDLRYGMASGLDGADKICQTIATNEGFGNKTWRAFLSVTAGPVNAIDRVGAGPWYDRLGRLVATGVSGLIAGDRPDGDATVVADLPNEKGVQEHTANSSVDDHDTLTGSSRQGRLYSTTLTSTCNDWTSAVGSTGRPMAGHSWPGGPSQNWIQGHTMAGCAPGICLTQSGGGCSTACPSGGVGCEGGYGAIYCFALSP